jgi:MFS family permease
MWREPSRALKTIFVPPHAQTERNAYYLYVEVIFASLLSVAGSFNGAYIVRSGGSNALIGLLSSVPALLAAALYIPAARILEKQPRQMPWIVWGLLLSRLGYLIIPLLPLFVHQYIPEITVALLILMTIPSVFFSTAWNPMLSEVVSAQSRATVLAWRSILASSTVAPLIFLAGRWLDHGGPFPSNYQWLYIVGFAAGAYSVYLVSRIRMTEHAPVKPTLPDAASPAQEPWLTALRTTARENRGFTLLVFNALMHNLGAWMVGPLYIIFFVRQLGATDGWLGIEGTLANVGVILGYWIWRRVIKRIGEIKSLYIALPLYSAYALFVGMMPNLTFILACDFFVNLIGPGVNLSYNILWYDLLPEGKKHSATAIYSAIMNVGAFVAPMIGVALADRIGIVSTLLIGGVLRMAGASLYYFLPIKGKESAVRLPISVWRGYLLGRPRR